MADGRGRLGSLDLLPEECRDDLIWALQELHKRERTQADILFDFNDRIAVKGAGPVSKSAFNRRAMRLAANTRRMDEVRSQYEGLAAMLTPEKVDQTNLVIGEILKTLVFELAEEGSGDRTPKEAMELARAFQATIQGQKISADRRQKLEAEFKEGAGKAIDQVAKARGLSPEVQAAMRAELFGVPAEARHGP